MDHLVSTTAYKLMRMEELMAEAREERFWNQRGRSRVKSWRRLLPKRKSQ